MTRYPGCCTPDAALDNEKIMVAIHDAAARLKYGSIAVTVCEGRVVQMAVKMKRRLTAN